MILRYIKLRCIILCWVISRYIVLHYILLCYIILGYIILPCLAAQGRKEQFSFQQFVRYIVYSIVGRLFMKYE